MTATEEGRVATSLAAWGRAIDRSIDERAADRAARQAEAVLRRLPRHLPTYMRLLDLCWRTEHWDEGEEWARRLLQADPGNVTAWRALAQAAEARGQRRQANIIWRRAFEMSPYAAEIRAGLHRTSLDPPHALAYNLACLAALYLRGRRWGHAAESYRSLVKADPRRVDFQICLAVALWQGGEAEEAYAVARNLVARQPYLLMTWVVLRETGDENDQALAANPLQTMDPDGEYAAAVWGVGKPGRTASLLATPEEAKLLEYRLSR